MQSPPITETRKLLKHVTISCRLENKLNFEIFNLGEKDNHLNSWVEKSISLANPLSPNQSKPALKEK